MHKIEQVSEEERLSRSPEPGDLAGSSIMSPTLGIGHSWKKLGCAVASPSRSLGGMEGGKVRVRKGHRAASWRCGWTSGEPGFLKATAGSVSGSHRMVNSVLGLSGEIPAVVALHNQGASRIPAEVMQDIITVLAPKLTTHTVMAGIQLLRIEEVMTSMTPLVDPGIVSGLN
ncbi:hypothetical protein RRG08_067088 [Elysia crispata]|uniref:Uncharacterized protein n=1 Tax=Elysia crispata TaxID=231223 RepID=A0AAE1EC60_9GAST|nr:hypothetical protein RRG08_067088 [Elysia crispata]